MRARTGVLQVMNLPDDRSYRRLYGKLIDELEDFAIFLMAPDGRILTWNAGVERILGYKENEFVGQQVEMLFTPEDIAAGTPEAERRKALADGRAPDKRWHVRKDGTRLYVDGVVVTLKVDDGTTALTKIMRDKTGEKRAEEERERLMLELRAQTQRHFNVIESISDAFYAVDSEFRFTYVNRRAEEWWRRSRNSLLGRQCWAEFPNAVGSESYFKHLQVMAERQPLSYEAVSPILQRWIGVSIYPEAGGGLSCYFQDISGRKAAERDRENFVAELARRNEDLGQFSYVVSHDLQAPLRMVRSYTELLDKRYRQNLDDTGRQFVDFIVDGATRMEELIRGLLAYAQANESISRKGVSVAGILEGVLSTLADAVEESGASITHDDLPSVTGDPVQLLQLFQNLIGNALKYRRAGITPVIHIGVQERDSQWLFSVRDNGVGFDLKEADRIFLPLMRLHGAEVPGTGIGLAICKRVVERHGGKMWVDSQPGGGSTFFFTWPRDGASR